MGHFQRWLMGLLISIGGTLTLIIGLMLTVASFLTNSRFILLWLAINGFSAIIILWGNYIMEEERPRGRYRIEQ